MVKKREPMRSSAKTVAAGPGISSDNYRLCGRSISITKSTITLFDDDLPPKDVKECLES